ncbi:MAG TPA: M50 family metallopeptidase [Polyangiaceae bacterium]
MSGVAYYVIAGLGLAVLMVVHESGHYFAARYFGMRVLKFSIGFGPTIVKHQPKGSTTVYQIAIIPFLAYVQIDGMNPYEESDPKDKGSYANGTLWARMVTIAGGPLANYFFASILFFFGFLIAGRLDINEDSLKVNVNAGGPSYAAGIRDGDTILEMDGHAVYNWGDIKAAVGAHPTDPVDVLVDRNGEKLHFSPTPVPKGQKYEGKIEVGPFSQMVKVGPAEAAMLSVVAPAKVVYGTVTGLARLIMGKEKAELSGPVGIVKETAEQAKSGVGDLFQFLGGLSAYLGAFNLLPIPALDGGRLLFIGIEAASRRKPDAKIEARIHAVGLLMMLTLIAVVTWTEIMPKH